MDEILSSEVRDGCVYVTTKLWIYQISIDHKGYPITIRVGPVPHT
ncbi:hypothetical protein [Tardiphaga sp. 841_E9_N1_2]